MNNTLIDNSIEALSMTATLRKCLDIDGIQTVSIATGYWDIPGLAILQKSWNNASFTYRQRPLYIRKSIKVT